MLAVVAVVWYFSSGIFLYTVDDTVSGQDTFVSYISTRYYLVVLLDNYNTIIGARYICVKLTQARMFFGGKGAFYTHFSTTPPASSCVPVNPSLGPLPAGYVSHCLTLAGRRF